jgi:hypothetical protein
MGGGLAARHATLKRRSGAATATHSQQRLLRIIMSLIDGNSVPRTLRSTK